MSEEKKELMDQVTEKAAEAFDKAKEVGANVAEKFKASAVGKEILGEDGKLGKEDLKRMGDDFAGTKVGKAILGEDGKFDIRAIYGCGHTQEPHQGQCHRRSQRRSRRCQGCR